MGAVLQGRMEMLQRDADLSHGHGGSWVLQLCHPKARLVPQGSVFAQGWGGSSPAHMQGEAELLLKG